VRLAATRRLHELLSHLYVLIPVLDNDKHYWVSEDEVEKLLRHGDGWLSAHPERELIARRYLKHQSRLARSALDQLIADDEPAPEVNDGDDAPVESEQQLTLNEQRLAVVIAALKESGARRVLDLGCGEGKLLRMLVQDDAFVEVVGVDVSHRALGVAQTRLERLPELLRPRVRLLHGSLMYRDARLADFDAAAVVEVVEHFDPPRLTAFERVLFEFARPRTVVLTTPNAEYNVKFATLPTGAFRHKDHRFEWTRPEFQAWATRAAERFGYRVVFRPVGPEDAVVGAPTQMGIFSR
jgi:3' terminal RNA ribose 2'-O-methyltransferase Hen1